MHRTSLGGPTFRSKSEVVVCVSCLRGCERDVQSCLSLCLKWRGGVYFDFGSQSESCKCPHRPASVISFSARSTIFGATILHPAPREHVESPTLALAVSHCCAKRVYLQSRTRKGPGREGLGSFCKEFPCFNTVPCRPAPSLANLRHSLASQTTRQHDTHTR